MIIRYTFLYFTICSDNLAKLKQKRQTSQISQVTNPMLLNTVCYFIPMMTVMQICFSIAHVRGVWYKRMNIIFFDNSNDKVNVNEQMR